MTPYPPFGRLGYMLQVLDGRFFFVIHTKTYVDENVLGRVYI